MCILLEKSTLIKKNRFSDKRGKPLKKYYNIYVNVITVHDSNKICSFSYFDIKDILTL